MKAFAAPCKTALHTLFVWIAVCSFAMGAVPPGVLEADLAPLRFGGLPIPDVPSALSEREAGLARARSELGSEHPDTAIALHPFGSALMAAGRFANAKRIHQEALRIRERTFGPTDIRTAQSQFTLGRFPAPQGGSAPPGTLPTNCSCSIDMPVPRTGCPRTIRGHPGWS